MTHKRTISTFKRFVNLTGQDLHLAGLTGKLPNQTNDYDVSLTSPREIVLAGITLLEVEVTLPPPEPGVMFIVPANVAPACGCITPSRYDLAYPGEIESDGFVRDLRLVRNPLPSGSMWFPGDD